MTLVEVIQTITNYLDLDPVEFSLLMAEDTIGGYNPDASKRTFDFGPWEIEMQTLYAILRMVKPYNVLEIGNCWANSTSHICAALRANGHGHLLSIDTNPQIIRSGKAEQYEDVASFEIMNVFDFPFSENGYIDFVFDDSAKTHEEVSHTWGQYSDVAFSGGMIVAHDSEHDRLGPIVRGAIESVLVDPYRDYISVQIPPALCGLAVWRKP